VTAKSTDDCRTLEQGGIVAFHQADVGRFFLFISPFLESDALVQIYYANQLYVS
jgi:hypothetical protein